MRLPSIHIMSAGAQVAPYAWIAARCLWLSCPKDLRDQLEINIHIFGVRKAERATLGRLFANQPYLKLRRDTILLDDQLGFLGKQRFELMTPTARELMAKASRHLPPLQPLAKRWLGRAFLGLYYQEWINQLCRDHAQDPGVMVVDADLFMADPRLFDESMLMLSNDEYGLGWVWRTNNHISLNGKTYQAIGSELFLINPALHNQLNPQTGNFDTSSFTQLKRDYPGLAIGNEEFVDTLYFACWKAQLEGYRVETRYNHLQVCHPGGVGHLDAQHLTAIPDEVDDPDKWLRLTIGRVRIHYRVLSIIERIGLSAYLNPHLLTRLGNIKDVIDANEKFRTIYADESHQIEGEQALNRVEELICSNNLRE